jgi:hypothetical protein
MKISHLELLESATKYMYFNINRKLFQTVDYKGLIKELFEKHWFLGEINQLTVEKESDIILLNNYISSIKNNGILFNRLFHYPLKRTGNAEVMLFLLIKNSFLSNISSSGTDIVINNNHYEIKHCVVSKKYNTNKMFYNNFKLGNSFCPRPVVNNVENYFGKIPKGSEMAEARKDPKFLEIESEYRDLVYSEYFSKHNMLFIDKHGEIKFVGKIKKENIFIDTITEGTIKPMILIEN